MPNWCNNYIEISGSKENMKPLYDYFNEGQKVIDKYYEDVHQYRKDNPDATDNGIGWEENLVMNTLVPHDEEYEEIKRTGDFILVPQDKFYGTKWDFDLREANLNQVDEDCITLAPSTAWSPPTEFCEKLCKKYNVEVSIQYEEGGVGFVGKETFNNEGLVEQEFYDDYYEGLYFLDKETFWSMMDSDLDDTEDITEDEFIEKYPYLNEADQKQLRKDFKEYKTAD
jgi:hypothetical protein